MFLTSYASNPINCVSHGQHLLAQSVLCLHLGYLNFKNWDSLITDDTENCALSQAAESPSPISLSPMLIRT